MLGCDVLKLRNARVTYLKMRSFPQQSSYCTGWDELQRTQSPLDVDEEHRECCRDMVTGDAETRRESKDVASLLSVSRVEADEAEDTVVTARRVVVRLVGSEAGLAVSNCLIIAIDLGNLCNIVEGERNSDQVNEEVPDRSQPTGGTTRRDKDRGRTRGKWLKCKQATIRQILTW
nr:hypothetical protein CFP56_31813 [Quercus suber]